MNGVMRPMGGCDEVVWIGQGVAAVNDVININRIHVVHENLAMDFKPLNAKIAAIITNNDLIAKVLPLSRTIESLVDVPIKPERTHPNLTGEREIAKALNEFFNAFEFPVGSSTHRRHRPLAHDHRKYA